MKILKKIKKKNKKWWVSVTTLITYAGEIPAIF